jgi:putative radical SAM enzyme (TIGR03279 family)
MIKKQKHIVATVEPDSIAEELGLEPGDEILKINNEEIKDILDYRFLVQDEEIVLTVKTKQGETVNVEIEKDADEDLGIEFENDFMDNYRSCHNKCIFCFIDQMPPGMRETLYFKDDDDRLSFLQGNYVTLTNMDDDEIDRIIRYRLEPMNISFQAMNPELRCKMLNNRFAGDALKKVDKLYEAGIIMNGQIVLCKGWNDKEELEYSLKKLYQYVPVLESVSVVPVGLSKYREGLAHLEPFTKEDAKEVIKTVKKWQDKAYKEHGLHFVHASDEWYFLAEEELPDADVYDGYLQLSNGVGMIASEREDFYLEYNDLLEDYVTDPNHKDVKITCVTGKLAYSLIVELSKRMEELLPNLTIEVVAIRNDFFGELITVTGLITATDLMAQLKGKDLGDSLCIHECMLRSGEQVFLDDYTVSDVMSTLQVPVDIVKSNGGFISKILEIYER